jgi:F-type H+-transporting ATPase subunit delta
MAERVTVARPYAKAAFEYARERKAFAEWSKLLATAAAVVADPGVEKLLASPLVTPQQLVDLLADIVSNDRGGKLEDESRNFLETLAHNRRLGLLPEIAAVYETLRAQVENVADVQVISAFPLDTKQRERLAAALQKRLRCEIRLNCEVDPQLIGGAVVRSGDIVIDGSLRARLERLAAEISL